MNDLHIPMHTKAAMLNATSEAREAAKWADREADLRRQIDEHQAWADAERARIEEHINAEVAKAKKKIDDIDATAKRLKTDLGEAGRRTAWHADQAGDAHRAVQDWCAHHGIDPATLPPVSDGSGPLPVVDDKALALGQQLARPEGNGDPQATRADVVLPPGVQAVTGREAIQKMADMAARPGPDDAQGTADSRADLPEEAPEQGRFQGGDDA